MTRLPRKLVLRIAIIGLANLAVFFTAVVLFDEASRTSCARPWPKSDSTSTRCDSAVTQAMPIAQQRSTG